MKIINLIVFLVLIFPLNLIAVDVPNRNMLCDDDDPDFKHYWHGFPKCNRNVSSWRKQQLYDEWGISKSDRKLYYWDHAISLFAGGSNHDDNLIPILRSESTSKLEYRLYLKLKRSQITQQQVIDLLLDTKGY